MPWLLRLSNSGVNQTSTQSSKVRRFEAGSMNIGSGMGNQTSGSRGSSRDGSAGRGGAGNSRYQSIQQQTTIQTRYQTG